MRHLTAALLAWWCGIASPAFAQVAAMVSRNSAGTAANSHSFRPAISDDGRYVAFESWASNLAAGVAVANSGVFVRDVRAGTTTLASTSDAGDVPNEESYRPDISSDGRFVAFWSQASNLAPGDTNAEEDLFVYDRTGGTVERVNVSTAGAQAAVADNGGHVVGDPPSISADGRYVAFDSRAPNLVAGDTNNQSDVFVRDRQSGTTERISLASDGSEAASTCRMPAISDDGRFVAFQSLGPLTPDDTNGQIDVYLYDRVGMTLQRVGATFGSRPAISGDGRFVAFESNATDLVPGDTNGKPDVFVFDRHGSTLERVSVASDGTQGNDDSSEPTFSQDGRYVAFRSAASNLVADDANPADDVFLRDRQAGTTMRIGDSISGAAGDGLSRSPAINADGFFVAIESSASNLAPDDNFGAMDIFLAVREDTCPADPAKVFAGVCGCGLPDVDADHDGVFGCDDACPDDAQKVAPGVCGCGLSEADADTDGTLDCHDPATPESLATLARAAKAVAKQLTLPGADRTALAAQLRAHAASVTAALNNAAFSAKQKQRMGTVAQALTDLADASGAVGRAKRKALRAVKRLLKAL